MIFSSLQFLFFFLPIVIIGYILIPAKLLNLWLLVVSLYFYYCGADNYTLLLLSIIGCAYAAGIIIGKTGQVVIKRITLVISVTAMVLTMAYYKYFDFIAENINSIFHAGIAKRGVTIPIGISFFVFQAISYVVDVYRGEEYLKNPIDMALYISFFPQLIAGPIIRFHDIRGYLADHNRRISFQNLSDGLWRFTIGICKKSLIANNLGALADIVFNATEITDHSILYTWLGAAAYTMQIYYDFSGYSDMAIGLGKIFGFQFQENFNYPYMSCSVREFWRKWHMSLSQFFRDYVYIPLGGDRCSKHRWVFNIMVTWLLTGIWHGASWTYVIWGGGYGAVILLESKFIKHVQTENILMKIFMHIYTMIIVITNWVVFRASSIQQAYCYLKNMYGMGAKAVIDPGFVFQLDNYKLLLLIAFLCSTPVIPYLREKCERGYWTGVAYKTASTTALVLGLLASVSYIYMGSYNPFLYFMF